MLTAELQCGLLGVLECCKQKKAGVLVLRDQVGCWGRDVAILAGEEQRLHLRQGHSDGSRSCKVVLLRLFTVEGWLRLILHAWACVGARHVEIQAWLTRRSVLGLRYSSCAWRDKSSYLGVEVGEKWRQETMVNMAPLLDVRLGTSNVRLR